MSVPAIDHHATDYSISHAYWLSQAAALAYQKPDTIEAQARRWGFGRVRHHETQFQPPFPLEDTQAYTIASDHMIITAFRGTEAAQIRDWLSDINTPPCFRDGFFSMVSAVPGASHRSRGVLSCVPSLRCNVGSRLAVSA